MFTFGIVVEGIYDEQIIVALVNRIYSQRHHCLCRPAGDKIKLLKNFPKNLEEFRHKKVNKALVIRDAHLKSVNDLCDRMKTKIRGRNYPFAVKFYVVKEEIESWLLADEEAISKVIETRVSRINEDLESMPRPKEKLKQIISQAKKVYTLEVAREIAAEARLNIIEYRCPTFRKFKQSVLDC